jgi:polyhydroxybutyrate depolymerase
VVYPLGLPTKTTVDPQGLKPGWQISPGQNGDRVLKFVDEILTHLHQKFSIDDRRIYGTGFSNGGRFCYILWAQRPSLFAAFGICAGLIREPVRLTEPKPLLHIAGERDEVAPFQIQQQTIAIARQINGCSDRGEPCGQGCTLSVLEERAGRSDYSPRWSHLPTDGAGIDREIFPGTRRAALAQINDFSK